jgi:hypothetical protein
MLKKDNRPGRLESVGSRRGRLYVESNLKEQVGRLID